jgi:hypothetical protein
LFSLFSIYGCGEDLKWWLQARFNSKKLGQKEILPRIERNIKAKPEERNPRSQEL